MKKVIAFFLVFVFLLSAFGCNSGNEADPSGSDDSGGSLSSDNTGESGQGGSLPSDTEEENEQDVGPSLEIIKDGKTQYVMAIANDDDTYARTAARELRDLIYDEIKVNLSVTREEFSESEFEILIGETAGEASKTGFDREGHDWNEYPVHAKIYGSRLLVTAKSNFAIYDNIRVIADVLLAECKDGGLRINEAICEKIMNAVKNAHNDVSIMTQNVYYKDIEERQELLLAELEYYSADLIGLQEAKSRWITFLDEALVGYERVAKGLSVDGRDEICPIYYKADKFNLIDGGIFWLSPTPDVAGTGFEGAKNDRVASWGLFEIKATGEKIFLLNTHLDTAGEEVRTLELNLIFDFLKDYQEYPIYLTGDFNFQRKHDIYSLATNVCHDCHDLAESNLSKDKPTYNKWGEKSAFGDYIFAHKSQEHRVLFYKVIDEKVFGDYRFEGYVSDHYGIYIKVRI